MTLIKDGKALVVYETMEDLIDINMLCYTNGMFTLDVVNNIIGAIIKRKSRTFMIYVVSDLSEMLEITEALWYDTGLNIYSLRADSYAKYSLYDMYVLDSVEPDNVILSREQLNLGISYIFIVKNLVSPLIRY